MNNLLVRRAKVSWADSDTSGTTKTISWDYGAYDDAEWTGAFQAPEASRYGIFIKNRSADTALTVKLFNRENDADGNENDYQVGSDIAVGTTSQVFVEETAFNLGQGAKIELSNDSDLPGDGAFDAHVVVRSA